jgi:hypothetical protein
MKTMLLAVFLAFATLALPHPAAAQAIDPVFEQDIKKMLEVTGAMRLGEQMSASILQQMSQSMRQANPNIPPRMFEIATEVTQALFIREFPSLLPKLVMTYANVLTHDEVKQLLAFYATPLGKRMIEVMPALQQAGARAGQDWAQELVPQLQSELMARFKREGFVQ